MDLKEQLMQDLKEAMKQKDEIKKNTVQLIRSAVLQEEKDNKVILQDDGVLDIIAKQLKKRKDTLPEFEKSGRQDLIDNLNKEIEILLSYLPEQLSQAEIEAIVKEIIETNGITSKKEMGKIMSAVMPKVKGRADGKMINIAANKFLS